MLNLYKLEIFAIVVQTGSFSAAAERLLLTQPAISQHIQDLESHLGTSLFQRGRRGVTLTQAGRILHEYTLQILRLLAEAENAVADVNNLAAGQIVVGATPGVSVYLLPDWVQAFRQRSPKRTVVVQTGITPQIVAGLRSGQLDLGLIEGELDTGVDRTGLGMLALEENEQFVVVGPRHPWWGRKSVRLADLSGQNMVMRQRSSQTRIWLEQALQQADLQVHVTAEFDTVESIKRAVARGEDLAILPDYAVRAELELKLLHMIALEGRPLLRTLKLVWNRNALFSPATRAFLRFLAAVLPALHGLELD